MERKSIKQMWGLPLRKVDGNVWFLDETGVCQVLSIDDFLKAYGKRLKELHTYLYRWSAINLSDYHVYNMSLDDYYAPRYRHLNQAIRSAGTYLEVGDTIDDYYRYLEECADYYDVIYQIRSAEGRAKPLPNGLDRFITKIERPNIIRFPENTNKNTFDMIKVLLYTVTNWESPKQTYFNEHIDEVFNKVLDRIETNKTFLKYDVPIGCLALTDILKDEEANSYEFIFELKQRLKDMIDSE